MPAEDVFAFLLAVVNQLSALGEEQQPE